MRDCEKIYVMKESILVESGDHEELLSKNGEYFQLHQNETVKRNAEGN